MKKLLLATSCLFLSLPVASQVSFSSSQNGGWFYGGGIGANFANDKSYFELSPMIGRHVLGSLSVGVGGSYRYTKDKRVEPEVTSHDYGLNVFARYSVSQSLFLEAAVEHINYEQNFSDLSSERRNFTSYMAGGGIKQSLGNNTSFYASALYNFSAEDDDSPYDDPWNIRFGIAKGF